MSRSASRISSLGVTELLLPAVGGVKDLNLPSASTKNAPSNLAGRPRDRTGRSLLKAEETLIRGCLRGSSLASISSKSVKGLEDRECLPRLSRGGL